jgi:hypothetical protein
MVLWQSRNNKKMVEKPLNFQHLHSKTRCSSHILKNQMSWGAFQNCQNLHPKTRCWNHIENLALCLAKTCFQSFEVQNWQVFNGVWGLKESIVSTNYWNNLLFKQCLKPWPNHSQVLACYTIKTPHKLLQRYLSLEPTKYIM